MQHSIKGQTTMTAEQNRLIEAQIAKLLAETANISNLNVKYDAEIAKLNAETAKIHKETIWYPLLIATGLVGAIAALVKLFF